MAFCTQPKGDGTQWVMKWEDYLANDGFDISKAWTEPMPEKQELEYMKQQRKELENEE